MGGGVKDNIVIVEVSGAKIKYKLIRLNDNSLEWET